MLRMVTLADCERKKSVVRSASAFSSVGSGVDCKLIAMKDSEGEHEKFAPTKVCWRTP